MKLAYLGTPEAAVPPLDALVDAGHEIVTVVTRGDTRRGRGSATTPSPVKAAAERHDIPVTHEVDDLVEPARRGEIELGVVVAYGRIIRPHVLDVLPMVNIHFSLLPRWRGAAPVERAILAGDEVTGVCLMAVEEGLDTGGVYGRVDVPVAGRTLDELRAELVAEGSRLLVDRLAGGLDGLGAPEPQAGTPIYADKIRPEELRLDWTRPAVELERVVRLGGAWTTFRGKRIKILAAQLVDEGEAEVEGDPRVEIEGSPSPAAAVRLVPTEVRPEGKPAMSFEAWRNGARPAPGEWFE